MTTMTTTSLSRIASRTLCGALLVGLTFAAGAPQALAKEVEVRTLNRGPAGTFFVFSPEVVRIDPGDTINFIATDKGHEVHAVPGMIPDGARLFEGAMGQDARVTFAVPGIYVVACKPHTPMGMVAVIVVGDPVNREKIDPSALTGKARSKLESLLASLR
jgi:pseudoazurin